MSLSKGATWNRWDLHVHTPESFDHQFSTDADGEYDEVWERYIDELSEIDDVSCLGITDYFSIDGYERVRKAKVEGRLENLDLVIPNIELRIDNVVVERGKENKSGASRSIDLHVLFSEDLDPDTIRKNFLHRVDALKPNGEEISLARENIERLGRERGIEHLDERSGDDFQVGCERLNVKRESVFDALDKEVFEGKYLIVLDDTTWDDIPWKTRAGTMRANLASQADAFFSSNENTRNFLLGQHPSNTPKEVIETFGSLKPCIHGSDAHDFASLCAPDEDRYCWIKAETTFEGLKQIKYEPDERVRIQPEDPQGHVPGYTPERVEIRDGEVEDVLTVTDTDLPLNPNLVTVIGGKGAGKTTLLDLIANCFEDRCRRDKSVPIDENSFIQRIEDENPEILTRLEFNSDSIDGFHKRVRDKETIESAQVEYLPQGKISEYCRKKEKLHEQIINLIKSSVRQSDRNLMNRFDEKLDEISAIEDELEDLTRSLYQFEPETINSRIQDAREEVKTAKAKLEDKKTEIEEYREQHGDELQNNSATDLQNEIDSLEGAIESLESYKAEIEDVLNEIDGLEEVNESLASISIEAEERELGNSVSPIEYRQQLRSLQEIKNTIDKRIDTRETEKEAVEAELENLTDAEERLSELLTEKRDIESDLEKKHTRLETLRENKQQITKLRKKRREQFKQYVSGFVALENVYQLVIEEFNRNQVTILDDVDFSPQVTSDESLSERLHDCLDGRQVNVQRLQEALANLDQALEKDSPERGEYVERFLDKVEGLKQYLVSDVDERKFDELLYDSYLSLTEEIYFQGTKMEGLSLGQKGTVLLKILLAEGSTPLIIDQPEENLDNRFIYKTLKDTFREAKKQRQVIIATHNANLVVNTDAEQVVIANYEESEINFTAGPLENPQIRDEVTTLLEGGKKAFRYREQKYGLTD
ncbi:hypothetical protein NGM10_02015 [Halorussus salilacus]|uniref:TrlF family AAA-like ATPase n=1 Tax=Halorussus salilacus TaxID=2953750 RepID=UPI00209C8653|nr:hypothetical protein [Halorussus salilacus]USZ68527.1 hypothetical protein NGM10_02015 [Halorussus salilacus]